MADFPRKHGVVCESKKIVLREEIADMLRREILESLRRTGVDFSLAEIVKARYMVCRDIYERSDENRQGKLMLALLLDEARKHDERDYGVNKSLKWISKRRKEHRAVNYAKI